MIYYNNRNWILMLMRLRGSIALSVSPQVMMLTGVGFIAALSNALDDDFDLTIPSDFHQYLSVGLGFLLVVRVFTAYTRYWQALMGMQKMSACARLLAVQASNWVEGTDEKAKKDRAEIQRLTFLTYAIVMQDLRDERNLRLFSKSLITREERDRLEKIRVRPPVVFQWLYARIANTSRQARLVEVRMTSMFATVRQFLTSWSEADAIVSTPFPFPFAQMVKVYVFLYSLLLPFSFMSTFQWMTPVASGLIGYFLFGIDAIAVEIENPFGYDINDLPVDEMLSRIEEQTRRIIEMRDGIDTLPQHSIRRSEKEQSFAFDDVMASEKSMRRWLSGRGLIETGGPASTSAQAPADRPTAEAVDSILGDISTDRGI